MGNLNNHLGVPLTLLRAPRSADILVVEMGANHVGEIARLCEIARPTHGLITNIGRAHLEGFGGLAGVRRGKGELYDWLAAHAGCGFVRLDDPDLAAMSARLGRVLGYTTSVAPTVDGPELVLRGTCARDYPTVVAELVLPEGDSVTIRTQLPGRHNYLNLAAAAAVASYFKVQPERLVAAMAAYAPHDRRSETVSYGAGRVLLDAYNANPDSMRAAWSWLASRSETHKLAVLGEMAELGASAKTEHALLLRDIADSASPVEIALVGGAWDHLPEAAAYPVFAKARDAKGWFAARAARDDSVCLLKGSRANSLERLLREGPRS